MNIKHFAIIAAACIGAAVLYQQIQADRAKEQCVEDAVAMGASAFKAEFRRCVVRFGRYTPDELPRL